MAGKRVSGAAGQKDRTSAIPEKRYALLLRARTVPCHYYRINGVTPPGARGESALARRVRPIQPGRLNFGRRGYLPWHRRRRRAAKENELHNARVRRTRVPATVDTGRVRYGRNQNTFFLPRRPFGRVVKRFRHPVHPKSLTGRLAVRFRSSTSHVRLPTTSLNTRRVRGKYTVNY